MTLDLIHTQAIIKEIHTDGHSPLLVLGSDFNKYVVKNDKGKQPPFSIINELFAAYCLKRWCIHAPWYKLINVSNALPLRQGGFSTYHKTFYYDYPAFGSAFIEPAYEVNDLIITAGKKAFSKLTNPQDVLHITLFDTWGENDDRKLTNYNLILKATGTSFTIMPIDHAFIFSTMAYKDLNPQYVAVSNNEHLLDSELGYLIKRYLPVNIDLINDQREYFYLCIKRCKENFDDFI